MNNNAIKMSKEELIKFIDQRMPFREYTKAAQMEREQLQKELDLLKRKSEDGSD